MSSFYEQFDELYLSIENLLNDYNKSTILQNHFMKMFKSLFYANILNNFFINLNNENVKEFNLPKGKIGKIKRKYKDLRKDIKLALSSSPKNKKIDGKLYNDFKTRIKKDFPEFQKIIKKSVKTMKKFLPSAIKLKRFKI